MCAWAIINALKDTNCDEYGYIYIADTIKSLIIDNDSDFIKNCYMKACEASEANEGE